MPLDAKQLAEIEAFDCDSTEELEVFLVTRFEGHRAILAWAKDKRIWRWASADVGEEGVLSAAIQFMDDAIAATPSKSHTAQEESNRRLRKAEQARADATRKVLEPA